MSNNVIKWEPRQLEHLLAAEDRSARLDQLLMGTGISRERFVGMTIQAIARQPKLRECTPESVLLSVLSVAELGLVPSGAYGGAWLVPYRETCKYIIDWRGFLKLAYRSGILQDAYAEVRYASEPFVVWKGTNPRIEHEYALERPVEDAVTHYYAVAHLRTGGHVAHVMTAREIEAIRDRQPQWERGPWASDPLEMGRKTAVRNLFKYVPEAITPQLAAALEQEDSMDALEERAATRPISSRRARILAAAGAAAGEELASSDAEDGQAADVEPSTEQAENEAALRQEGL